MSLSTIATSKHGLGKPQKPHRIVNGPPCELSLTQGRGGRVDLGVVVSKTESIVHQLGVSYHHQTEDLLNVKTNHLVMEELRITQLVTSHTQLCL